MAWVAPAIGLGSSLLSGWLNRDKGEGKSNTQNTVNKYQETPMDKKKAQLIDQLLASVNGNGPYSKLFDTDESAFQKNFVDPAKSMFTNQIAPQIQQSYIAGGQQRGTGIDDQLLRAGVDLDQQLNSNYLQFQSQGNDRMSQILGNVLGFQGPQGTTTSTTTSNSSGPQEGFGNVFAGYLNSDSFSNLVHPKNQSSASSSQSAPRAGFKNDLKLPEFDYRMGR